MAVGDGLAALTSRDALRAAGWVIGTLGALSGLLGPVLARSVDSTSMVGIFSGSGACALGAVILDRRPANRCAWGFLAGGVLLVAFSLCYSWAAGQVRAGNTTPRVGTVAAVAEIIGTLAGGSLPLFQFLFPDGRLPSPRWRPVFACYLAGWLGGAVAVAVALWPHRLPGIVADNGSVPIAVPAELDGALRVIGVTEAFAAVFMLLGVAAVAVRLRRARGDERAQILLGLWGLAVTALLIAATALLSGLGADGVETITSLVAPVPLLVAVTVAMRRHRLFDVERLVGQTITYVTITTLLVALYAGTAIGLGALAGALGLGSGVAVAAATLAVAGAFRPLLRLVKGVVDRRFDRRTWLAVRAVEDFTRRLRSGDASPGDLVAALRTAMDDPTATAVYLDGSRTIDLGGAPAELAPLQDARRLRREVSAGGAPVAVVELDGRLAGEPHLVEAALSAAALPLENAALHARAAVRLAEVAASRSRIVEADDLNRRRIERDLHDGAQQRLVALALRLRMAERELGDRRAAAVLADAVAELRATVDELRELTRGILPPVLSDEGLAVALRTAAARMPVPVTLDITPDRLPPTIEATAWFFACEGMTNAAKHARGAALTVRVQRAGTTVQIEVGDTGGGGAQLTPGGGLQGLADRVAAVGGRFTMDSPPGGGTRLSAELPCAS
ncbi:histidine kinase [Actinomadura sp. NPDC048394]|uniref:sensor histidine kinase n=1 Tax=Actinomadura sp. NPDC048394 TaxID=3158223 RepID=UPI0033C9B8E4